MRRKLLCERGHAALAAGLPARELLVAARESLSRNSSVKAAECVARLARAVRWGLDAL